MLFKQRYDHIQWSLYSLKNISKEADNLFKPTAWHSVADTGVCLPCNQLLTPALPPTTSSLTEVVFFVCVFFNCVKSGLVLQEKLSTCPALGGNHWLSVIPFYYNNFIWNSSWWESTYENSCESNKVSLELKLLPMEIREKVLISSIKLPPKAVPFHVRPVTSWNGRVAISSPDAATPTTTLTPQPLWQASSAALCRQIQPSHRRQCILPRITTPSPKPPQGEGGVTKFCTKNGNKMIKLNVQ